MARSASSGIVLVITALAWLTAEPRGGAVEPEEARTRAVRIAAEGAVAYKAERYSEALAKFSDAYRLFPAPPLLLNMSRAELKLRRCGDALRYAERYRVSVAVDLGASPDSPQDWLDTLHRSCIESEVTSTPAGAAIWIDGERETRPDTTPWEGRLLVGKHRVLLWKSGYGNREETLEVAADRPARLALILPPEVVASAPGSPPEPTPVSPPPTVTAPPTVPVAGAQPHSPTSRALRWEPLVPAGVAVLGLAIAIAEGVVTKQCPTSVGPPQAVADAVSCQHNNAEVADVGWGFAGAGAVTAGILWLVLKPQTTQSPEAAPVHVSLSGNGVLLLGRF